MTSSLSSSESGDELESVSIPSESLLLSSLMLITPPMSTVCLGTFGWRPLGFPAQGRERNGDLEKRPTQGTKKDCFVKAKKG